MEKYRYNMDIFINARTQSDYSYVSYFLFPGNKIVRRCYFTACFYRLMFGCYHILYLNEHFYLPLILSLKQEPDIPGQK